MADDYRRHSRHGIPVVNRGESGRPARGRRLQGAAPELGVASLLRSLLSAAAAGDGHRSPPRIRRQPELYLRSPSWRARQAVGSQPDHSLSRLESGDRQLSDQSLELARSQQYWKLQSVLADHLVRGADSGLGPFVAFAYLVAQLAGSSGLCQPDRPG